jgi:transcriptional regulator with XRE-family HTH domain
MRKPSATGRRIGPEERPDAAAFGQRLERLLEREGVSKAELARRLGKSRGHVTRLARGFYTPRHEELPLLAAALNTTLTELLGETPPVPSAVERAELLFDRALAAARGVPVPVLSGVPAPDLDLDAPPDGTLGVPDAVLAGHQAVAAVPALDDALVAWGIRRGDHVLVERAARPRSGDLVLARAGGGVRFVTWQAGVVDAPEVLGVAIWHYPAWPRRAPAGEKEEPCAPS